MVSVCHPHLDVYVFLSLRRFMSAKAMHCLILQLQQLPCTLWHFQGLLPGRLQIPKLRQDS